MNHSDGPLDPREDALVRALAAQAETVRPAGDGLVRIRARVERRRSRTRWLVPSASAAAVAATVTAVVASGAFTSGRQSSQLSLNGASLTAATTPTATPAKAKRVQVPVAAPTPVATPTKTARAVPSVTQASPVAPTTTADVPVASAVAADHYTLVGPTPVWPFANAAAAAEWQKSAASDAWQLSPVATATHFVNALKLTGVTLTGKPEAVDHGAGATDLVTLERKSPDSDAAVSFATVEVSHWGPGPLAPWGVVGVSSPGFSVSAPAARDTIRGSFQVVYTAPGSTEGQVDASVRQVGTGTVLTHATAQTPGTVTLPTSASSGAAYVVVTNTSGGGTTPTVGSLAVVPVQLAASATPADTYVALVGGAVKVIDATSGNVVRTLAPGAADVTEVAVSDDRKWVYFLEGGTGCHGTVWRTRLDGTGTAAQFSTYLDGLSTFGIAGPSAPWMTYVYTPCTGAQQTLFFFQGTEGPGPQNISATSRPPDVKTVAISPDGKQASAFVRTGTQGNVWTFDLTAVPPAGDRGASPTMDTHTTPAACSTGIECVGETYDNKGDLFVVRSNGSQLEVARETGTVVTSVFSVPASSQLATIDVDPTGTKVVLTDGVSQGWVWDGTKATALPAGVTDASW